VDIVLKKITIETTKPTSRSSNFIFIIKLPDKEFLNENNIADGASLMDDKYGHITYASGKIPVSEVTILRRRKDLPVDRRRKI